MAAAFFNVGQDVVYAQPVSAYLAGRAQRMAYEGEKQQQAFVQMQMQDYQKQRDFDRQREAAEVELKAQKFQQEQQDAHNAAIMSGLVTGYKNPDRIAGQRSVQALMGGGGGDMPPPVDPTKFDAELLAGITKFAAETNQKIPDDLFPKQDSPETIRHNQEMERLGQERIDKPVISTMSLTPGGGRIPVGFENDPDNPGQVRPIVGSRTDPEYQARLSTEKDMTGGVTGRTKIAPLNAVAGHIAQLGPLVRALKNGSILKSNQVKNEFKRQFGGIDVTNFDAVSKFVSSELVNTLMPGRGTEKDREQFQQTIMSAYSTGQIEGVINQYLGLMSTQAEAHLQRWDSAGLDHDRGLKLFSPLVRSRLEQDKGGDDDEVEALISKYAGKPGG